MNKNNNKPISSFASFYQTLRKQVEKDLFLLLKKLKLYPKITVEKIKEIIYHCPKEKEMVIFDELLGEAKKINPKLSEKEIFDFFVFLNEYAWNYFPIKFLDNKSPVEKSHELVIQNPKQNIVSHPIFISLIMPFKIIIEDKLKELNHKDKIFFTSALPLLFKRFWFSPISEENKQSYPVISFLNLAEFFNLKNDFLIIPDCENLKEGKISFYSLPLEDEFWQLFPLIFDLNLKSKSSFYYFPDYYLMIEKLKKMKLPTDKKIFSLFIEYLLLNWKDQDPILKTLNDREWLSLWKIFLEKAAKDVVDTEAIVYPIILILRDKGFKVDFILNWMAKWPEIEEESLSKAEKDQKFFFFKLTTDFDRFFITPLTLALPVMYPLYADPFNLEEEINFFWQVKNELSLYRPSTKLTFNEYGRTLIKKYRLFEK